MRFMWMKRCRCVRIENVNPHWTTFLVIRVPTPFESQIWVNFTRFFSDACFYCGEFTWKCQNNWNIAMHWCPISLLLLSLSHSCQPTINGLVPWKDKEPLHVCTSSHLYICAVCSPLLSVQCASLPRCPISCTCELLFSTFPLFSQNDQSCCCLTSP